MLLLIFLVFFILNLKVNESLIMVMLFPLAAEAFFLRFDFIFGDNDKKK